MVNIEHYDDYLKICINLLFCSRDKLITHYSKLKREYENIKKEEADEWADNFINDESGEDNSAMALFNNGCENIILWVNDDKTNFTDFNEIGIAEFCSYFNHELIHIIKHIFDSRDLEFDGKHEEYIAYYVEYLNRIVLTKLFKKKIFKISK